MMWEAFESQVPDVELFPAGWWLSTSLHTIIFIGIVVYELRNLSTLPIPVESKCR